jgi:hypothetical protein
LGDPAFFGLLDIQREQLMGNIGPMIRQGSYLFSFRCDNEGAIDVSLSFAFERPFDATGISFIGSRPRPWEKAVVDLANHPNLHGNVNKSQSRVQIEPESEMWQLKQQKEPAD